MTAAPVVLLDRHVQIEEQRREAEPGAGHDARHQVALARAIDADQFHARRREHAHAEEPEQRIDPEQKRCGATGAADIREGMTGEGLAPDDGEHADHPGDNRGGAADHRRRAHRLAGEEPRLEEDGEQRRHADQGTWPREPGRARAPPSVIFGLRRDHQDTAMHAHDIDMVAIELAQHLGAHDRVGAAARRPAVGEIDDAVHRGKQRVHIVCGEQHSGLELARQAAQQGDDPGDAAHVQIGERFVQQQQAWTPDQGMRDQHPLLLAAGEVADPLIGERRRLHRFEHLVDLPAAP